MTQPRTAGKRGRRPARHVPELHLRRFQDPNPGPPPETADVTGGITDWGMIGNDTRSNCGDAAWVHYKMAKAGKAEATIGAETYQADDPALTQAALQPYFAYGRAEGEPGDEPDGGVDNATWLKFLFDNGLIEGFAQVDLTNEDEAKWAMINFKGVIIGAALSDQAETEFENHQPWQITSTEPIDPNLGHDFLWVAYDQAGGKCVTWAALQEFLMNAEQAEVAAHDIDAWVIISSEDATRAGVNLDALRAEISRLGGTLGQAPGTTPPVQPTPAPTEQPPTPPAPAPDPNSPRGALIPAEIRGRVERLFDEAKAEAHRIIDEVWSAGDQPPPAPQ